MRNAMILPLMAVTLTAAAFAKGPVGDWQTVQQDIPRGWQVTVVTAFTFPCIFEQAKENELVCEQIHHRWGAENNDIHVPRGRIQKIPVERGQCTKVSGGPVR